MTAPDVNAIAAPVCAVHEAPIDTKKSETRTQVVIGITALMMVAELIVGWWTHSLALLADGWHMGTHVGALGITALAYWYARTRAGQTQFAFGTGKVYALAGFTSAGLLIAVAIGVIVESVSRFIAPEAVDFGDALPVAVLGLLVNFLSAFLLGGGGHSHDHDHDHDHGAAGHDHAHAHAHDQNLRAAYLHVVADALTSVMAIVALLAGRYLNWWWVDPGVAIVGALVILKWGLGLLRETSRQLIDLDPSSKQRDQVKSALEQLSGTRVVDLHLWRVGPKQLVCVVSVQATEPRPLDEYKRVVTDAVPVNHLTIEICAA